MTIDDADERVRHLPGDLDGSMWPGPPALRSEAEKLLALEKTPGEWPPREQRIQQDDEEALSEVAVPEGTEAEAAVEEWTAGMVRTPADAETRELEEEPLKLGSQPALKSPAEAELEAKYGI
jgi:hypothetical protein